MIASVYIGILWSLADPIKGLSNCEDIVDDYASSLIQNIQQDQSFLNTVYVVL